MSFYAFGILVPIFYHFLVQLAETNEFVETASVTNPPTAPSPPANTGGWVRNTGNGDG